jgi:hypothetical protein
VGAPQLSETADRIKTSFPNYEIFQEFSFVTNIINHAVSSRDSNIANSETDSRQQECCALYSRGAEVGFSLRARDVSVLYSFVRSRD